MDPHFQARFLVGVRAPIYLAAGVMQVSFRKFLAIDAVCATLVVGTFFWISHYCGAWVGPLFHESQLVATGVVLVVLALGGVYYVAWKKYSSYWHLDEPSTKSDSEVETSED